MSRSFGAWTWSCGLVSAAVGGVGKRAGCGERGLLAVGRFDAVSFTKCLGRLLVAGLLVVALVPASALASGRHAGQSTVSKSEPSHDVRFVLAFGSGYS